MMKIVDSLREQADRLDAALAVYNGCDQLVLANDIHRRIYPFVDFSQDLLYRDIVLTCVRHGKFEASSVYTDPEKWLSAAASFRRFQKSGQSHTRHSDGRIFEITYEQLEATNGWWYQMRRDVTSSVKRRSYNVLASSPLASQGEPYLSINHCQLTVGLLDTLPHPATLITPEAQVIDTNRAFDELVAVGDGVVMVGGRLRFPAVPEEDRRFLRRAAEVSRAAGRGAGGEPVTLRLPRVDHTSPYFASLSVPPSGGSGAATPIPGVLLFSVIDPDTLPPVAPGIVANLLQITAAEAKVAMALAAGRTVDEIAGDRGVGRRTVYNQVTSILNKTGLRNQAGIVRQVTALSFALGPRLRPSR